MKGIKQIKDYRLLKELGRGANGIVYEAVEDKSNKFVAIKAIPNDKLNNPRLLEQFKKELKTLYRLSHKNIIKIVGVEKTINNVYLILEYCNGGTLYDYSLFYKRTYKTRLPELIVQKIIKQVIEGLKFMHKNNIIHRDIKLENILINFDDQANIYSENTLINKSPKELYNMYSLEKDNFTIKIADLGYARELEGGLGASTICGTPMTIAPEIVNIYSADGRDSKYNSAIDLWSLGAVLYELLMGVSPFVGGSKDDIMRKVYSGMYEIPSNISVSIESIYLLNGLLQFYPQKRLSWDQIVFHPFITKDIKKFKYIKLNSMMNQNYDDSINYDNKLLINSKDCRNFLWILFKATGASLPFELDELDKDTYEEVIKDVIANHMFSEPEENNDNSKNNNNHFEAAYLNHENKNNNLISELDNLNKRFQDINAEYDRVKINVPAESVKKENDHQQPMLNNESNFHLFRENDDSPRKEKEEEKIANNYNDVNNREEIVLKESEIAENDNQAEVIEINKDEANKFSNIDEAEDQEKHIVNEDAEINKEEDKREEDVLILKEPSLQEINKNEESVNQEKSSEEAHNNTNNQIRAEEADVSRLTENDEVLKKYLLLDKTIKLNDLYCNPEAKKNYINGSIDSQFSRESLNDQNDESQSKSYMNGENIGKVISPNNKSEKENNNILLEIISDNEGEKKKFEEKDYDNNSSDIQNVLLKENNAEIKMTNDDQDLMSFSPEYIIRSNKNSTNEAIESHKDSLNGKDSLNQDPKSNELNVEINEGQNENIEEKDQFLEFDEEFKNYILVQEEDLKDKCVEAEKYEDYEMIDNYFH